jgi:hypothetical protein
MKNVVQKTKTIFFPFFWESRHFIAAFFFGVVGGFPRMLGFFEWKHMPLLRR